jgi:hypothetical protein
VAVRDRLLLWTWEGPQSLLGLLLLGVMRARGQVRSIEHLPDGRQLVEGEALGVSLGAYVFWARCDPFGDPFELDLLRAHELGHTVQSRRLGPLYLPTVGVVSPSRALYAMAYRRRTGRGWARYYDSWPEAAADRHGGIVRQADGSRVLCGPAKVVAPPVPGSPGSEAAPRPTPGGPPAQS